MRPCLRSIHIEGTRSCWALCSAWPCNCSRRSYGPGRSYAGTLALALLGAGLAWKAPRPGAFAWLAAALLTWSVCGLRAAAFLAGALAPQLEGRDLRVTGVVAAMPQPRETGLRLRLEVESALLDGAPVRVPGLIDLSLVRRRPGRWRAGRGAPPARAAGGRALASHRAA
ncbi:DNA internalization-related competence protein ComEC/Rec2 [Alicycliphilus sp. B1]|nr:DNA internalization-related competence protein ComEC/Rec2 [Alicycliphilus sp. B1]